MVEMRTINPMRKKIDEEASLYDFFTIGDTVKRVYKDHMGKIEEHQGIVLAMDESGMEVFWHTKDGKYTPWENSFTRCSLHEVFHGDYSYSPVKKD
jgi:hypothetical protein